MVQGTTRIHLARKYVSFLSIYFPLRLGIITDDIIGLFFLMTYMHNQRQKALNRGPGRSMSGGKLRDVGGKKRG